MRAAPHAWTGALGRLPPGGRSMLTAFLIIMAAGYIAAVLTIYTTHERADGVAGMTLNDIRAVYRGMQSSSVRGPIPSRMLTMVEGQMREYIDDDRDFAVLTAWLRAGGSPSALDTGEGRRTPRRILIRACLRCHAESTGTDISRKASFGADEFDVEPDRLAPFMAPDPEQAGTSETWIPAQYTVPRLILFSHYHMLAMPLFTLAVGCMFMVARLPTGLRAILAPLPMIALLIDFAGWWLARIADIFVYVIASAGAVFGVAFAFQLLSVAVDIWRPHRTPVAPSMTGDGPLGT